MNKAKEKRPDYLVMVNLDNRLPDGFEDSFELISVKNEVGAEFRIEKKTYDAFLRLQKEKGQRRSVDFLTEKTAKL